MSKARPVITAVTVEKRPVSEVARSYEVVRSWVYALLARYEAEGQAAFEPRSRRPKTSPSAIAPDTADLITGCARNWPAKGSLMLVLRPGHQLLLGSLAWIRVVDNGVLVTARRQSASWAFPGGALRCRQRPALVARSCLRAFRLWV